MFWCFCSRFFWLPEIGAVRGIELSLAISLLDLGCCRRAQEIPNPYSHLGFQVSVYLVFEDSMFFVGMPCCY